MNAKNLTTGIDYSFGGIKESVDYTYNESKDNAPQKAKFTDGSSYQIAYDELGRKAEDTIFANGSFFYNSTYTYLNNPSDPNKTSGLVSKINYNLSGLENLSYTYDSRGNTTRQGTVLCLLVSNLFIDG